MAGIAFVAGEAQGSLDQDRKIGVDLDEAMGVALIPVVSSPDLVGDVLQREALVGWELHVAFRFLLSVIDGRLENDLKTVLRNRELLSKLRPASQQIARSWNEA